MLPEDWGSFEFSYILELPRLVPHLIALEAHQNAAGAQTLPPHWVDSSNTSDVLTWVRRRFVPGSAPLSVTDLLAIHRSVSDESGIEAVHRGALRTTSVRVGRPSAGGFHFGAPAEQLPALLDRYVAFLEATSIRTLPPVIRALLGHFFLDTIHPFLDGNGRTSRMIAAAILSRGGYQLQGSYAFVRHFYDHDLSYHKLLQRSWQRCPFDVTAFIAFGMEGVVAELRSIEAFLCMKRSRVLNP